MFGNGHPVVFLHGFLESLKMWDYLALDSSNIKAIYIDLPGHGLSDNEDDGIPSVEFMAYKVKELLDYLKIDEFSIVGHSMGGYVALFLKHIFPHYSKLNLNYGCFKIVLLNSNFWEDSEIKKNDRLRIVEIVNKNKELFIQAAIPNLFLDQDSFKSEISSLVNESLKMSQFAISYATLAMRTRQNFKNILFNNPKHFLIIHGDSDPVIPLSKMLEQLSCLDVKFEVLNNVGHMAHIEDSKNVLKLISGFLEY
jgi:2-succinyl-6-hydroxy-2,4-cyclohexadiene-1-carboxylate synthase